MVLTVLVMGDFSSAQAQDFKRQYKQARELFDNRRFAEAMDAFKPLMVYDENNVYPEYATFYYAVSAARLGYASVAKESLHQIRKLYPNWNQLEEVNFWLAKIYFDQGDFFQGLKVASLITTPQLVEDMRALKFKALSRISDAETLKMLLEENPSDADVAKMVARYFGALPIPNADQAYLDSVLVKFNFSREDFITATEVKPVLKESYQVALLFPFLANSLEPSPSRKKNQVVLDLYEGMRLAADTLAKEGIELELRAYDTERNSETISSLLTAEELKSVDLIVGPVYGEGQNLVQEFSNTHKINLVVNPLSNNSEFISASTLALLYQPSHETIGRKSAELVAEKVKNRNCLVYYDESPKDSVMAFHFIKRALELGINIIFAEEVRKETSGKILTTLATPTEFDEWKNPIQFKLKKDSIGCIFVASDDALIYTKVINSVEARGDSVLVVGQEGWLEDASVELHKFERIQVAFSSSNFSRSGDKPYQIFQKSYLKKHGVLPSQNARIGYEFLMVMGKILKQYGANFTPFIANGVRQPGSLTRGYQFLPTRDNGSVPFTIFREGELVVIKE